MAMDWYYVANQQQAGPVEFSTLQQMLQMGSLSTADMVFGPGLSAWTPAGQVPALASGGGGGGASMLGYRGAETGNSGLSQHALEMLRQTKPWTRFASILLFIGAGLMVVAGLGMMAMTASMGSRRATPLVFAGLFYVVLALLYIAPAMFLTRFSNSIADLLRTNRSSDLERALEGQKSYWKYVGIMTIIAICAGVIIGLISVVASNGRF